MALRIAHVVTVEVSETVQHRPHSELLQQIQLVLSRAMQGELFRVVNVEWTPTLQAPHHDGEPV